MVNTSLCVDIKYKAPNVGESLLMGIANGLGGCTSYGGYGPFGSLTGFGGYGMGCGGLTSDIGSILCGTAMNIAYGGLGGCGIGLGGMGGYGMGMYGMGGYGMGMYSFGGCSTDFALAQAGAQLGTELAAIGMNAIDRLTMSKSEKQAIKTKTEERFNTLAEAKLKKEHPEIITKIENAQKAVEAAKIIKTSTDKIADYDKVISDCKSKLSQLGTKVETAPAGETDEARKTRENKNREIDRLNGLIKAAEENKKTEEPNINEAYKVLMNAQIKDLNLANATPDEIDKAAQDALNNAKTEKSKKIEEYGKNKSSIET